MLRPSVISNTRQQQQHQSGSNGGCFHDDGNAKYTKQRPFFVSPSYYTIILCLTSFIFGMVVRNNMIFMESNSNSSDATSIGTSIDTTSLGSPSISETVAFQRILDRAMLHQRHCKTLGLADQPDYIGQGYNNHTAHLPYSGIIQAIQNYRQTNDHNNEYPYQCILPPEMECTEQQFTVIFMAYNPDRLQKMYNQIKKMLTDIEFSKIVAEVIVVWNGERHVDETPLGQTLVEFSKSYPVRISYPLKAGFHNDLLNRYHPRLQVKTKAIMYYDDDGPFYSYKATLGGFELWKRNSNAQIGAMARKLDLSTRALEESHATLNGPGDRFFISQCPTSDELHYNYHEFANFGARMVLPSGSFLHANYLCFIWHPIFEEIRQYVKQHPVNPDDGTVSTLVSQVSGRAPKVYPRRINDIKEEEENSESDKQQKRRRLMDGINWDTKGGHDKKMNWGRLRSDAANSLARYFGSINSGSIGWCYGTQYQKNGGEYCQPEFATVGMLPWMKSDHTPRDTCP